MVALLLPELLLLLLCCCCWVPSITVQSIILSLKGRPWLCGYWCCSFAFSSFLSLLLSHPLAPQNTCLDRYYCYYCHYYSHHHYAATASVTATTTPTAAAAATTTTSSSPCGQFRLTRVVPPVYILLLSPGSVHQDCTTCKQRFARGTILVGTSR